MKDILDGVSGFSSIYYVEAKQLFVLLLVFWYFYGYMVKKEILASYVMQTRWVFIGVCFKFSSFLQ